MVFLEGRCLVMPRGKPWSSEEEKRLRELVDARCSLREIAVKMGKSVESVRQKMFKLGLKELEQTQKLCSSSTRESLPDGLPTIEEALKELAATWHSLKKPDLSHTEVQRLKALAHTIIAYKQFFADYAHYREIEDRLIETSKENDALVRKNEEITKERDALQEKCAELTKKNEKTAGKKETSNDQP
jgi:chromosome segregation ATPase